tara:strand:+ start:763 stop:1056 length:294 start_codon:yes stop_codon:yes gene_type:complete
MEKNENANQKKMQNLLKVLDEREYTKEELHTIQTLVMAIQMKKEEDVTHLESTFLVNWCLAEDRKRVDEIMDKSEQTEEDIEFMADWILAEWDALED